ASRQSQGRGAGRQEPPRTEAHGQEDGRGEARLMFLFSRVITAAALALTLAGPVQAHAQGASVNPLANPNDNQPPEINADSGIEWQQNAMVYIARGNAVAKRGNSELHGSTLVAHYRPLKAGAKPASGNAAEGQMGNTEIYRVDADGGVMLKREAQTVVG